MHVLTFDRLQVCMHIIESLILLSGSEFVQVDSALIEP
jgi:hypothetical protein